MPKIDRSTEADTIRAFRRHTGLTQQRLGELLGCTNDAVSGFERDGAPGWMRYALFGVAVKEIGLRADVAAALVGITPAGPLLDRVPAIRVGLGSPAVSSATDPPLPDSDLASQDDEAGAADRGDPYEPQECGGRDRRA